MRGLCNFNVSFFLQQRKQWNDTRKYCLMLAYGFYILACEFPRDLLCKNSYQKKARESGFLRIIISFTADLSLQRNLNLSAGSPVFDTPSNLQKPLHTSNIEDKPVTEVNLIRLLKCYSKGPSSNFLVPYDALRPPNLTNFPNYISIFMIIKLAVRTS